MNFDIEEEEEEEVKPKKKSKSQTDWILYLSIFFFVLAIILMIVYFATLKTKTVEPVVDPEPVIEVDPEPVIEVPTVVSVIDENSSQRPLAVMIDTNIGDAKHAGLQDSYVNYEIIVEGGLTRIMAIYKDKDVGIIGPVRSARNYFIDYALEHDAVYAHFGWSPNAEEDIKKLKVQNINGMVDTSPYMRDRNLPSPHNVFTSTKRLRDYFDTLDYSSYSTNWQVFNYSAAEVDLAESESGNFLNSNLLTASRVSMTYSYYENRSYTYDSENKYYLRSKNGEPHIDRKSGEQLHYKNIIIMKVQNKTIDEEGRQQLQTTGTGKGYYITNGNAMPINWSKSSRSAKTKYTYENGTEIVLNDGNTFIQIVPVDSTITIN